MSDNLIDRDTVQRLLNNVADTIEQKQWKFHPETAANMLREFAKRLDTIPPYLDIQE